IVIEEATVSLTRKAFAAITDRVRAHEHAGGAKRRAKLGEDAREIGARNVEERRVREDAVERRGREIEREKILMQHFAAGLARHLGEARAAVEADGHVSAPRELREIATRAAAEVEDAMRANRKCSEERVDVLRDVVIARPLPERIGVPLVVRECPL